MSLKVHVHVKSGFCMIESIGRIVEKGLIGSKRSIVVEIRLRRVAVSFAQQRFLFLFLRASKYQMVGKKNPYESSL